MSREYAGAFVCRSPILARATEVSHTIDSGDSTPLHSRLFRVSPTQLEVIQKQVALMLERNIIEPSSSPWSSAVKLVRNQVAAWKFCVNYRRLNKITKKDAYPSHESTTPWVPFMALVIFNIWVFDQIIGRYVLMNVIVKRWPLRLLTKFFNLM